MASSPLMMKELIFDKGWSSLTGLFSGQTNLSMIILVSDQEPEATCDGNSICSFLQANTQVLFCCCKYTAEPSLRVSMWLSIVSARAFPNVPPRGIPTMASRLPKPSPTSTRWEHVLKHSLTPNSCKMWEFFTMNPINVNLPSDSELSKHVLQRREGSFLGSSSQDVHFGGKFKENREMWDFFPFS